MKYISQMRQSPTDRHRAAAVSRANLERVIEAETVRREAERENGPKPHHGFVIEPRARSLCGAWRRLGLRECHRTPRRGRAGELLGRPSCTHDIADEKEC